jgi:hypothetical protein
VTAISSYSSKLRRVLFNLYSTQLGHNKTVGIFDAVIDFLDQIFHAAKRSKYKSCRFCCVHISHQGFHGHNARDGGRWFIGAIEK